MKKGRRRKQHFAGQRRAGDLYRRRYLFVRVFLYFGRVCLWHALLCGDSVGLGSPNSWRLCSGHRCRECEAPKTFNMESWWAKPRSSGNGKSGHCLGSRLPISVFRPRPGAVLWQGLLLLRRPMPDDIMAEEAPMYFSGSKTAEEVADIVENRIQVYVNETK